MNILPLLYFPFGFKCLMLIYSFKLLHLLVFDLLHIKLTAGDALFHRGALIIDVTLLLCRSFCIDVFLIDRSVTPERRSESRVSVCLSVYVCLHREQFRITRVCLSVYVCLHREQFRITRVCLPVFVCALNNSGHTFISSDRT